MRTPPISCKKAFIFDDINFDDLISSDTEGASEKCRTPKSKKNRSGSLVRERKSQLLRSLSVSVTKSPAIKRTLSVPAIRSPAHKRKLNKSDKTESATKRKKMHITKSDLNELGEMLSRKMTESHTNIMGEMNALDSKIMTELASLRTSMGDIKQETKKNAAAIEDIYQKLEQKGSQLTEQQTSKLLAEIEESERSLFLKKLDRKMNGFEVAKNMGAQGLIESECKWYGNYQYFLKFKDLKDKIKFTQMPKEKKGEIKFGRCVPKIYKDQLEVYLDMKRDLENKLKDKGHDSPKANIVFAGTHMILEVQEDRNSQKETYHSWAPTNVNGKSKVSKNGRVAEIKDKMARLVQCQPKNNGVKIPSVLTKINEDEYTIKGGDSNGGKIVIQCNSIEIANKVEDCLRGSDLIDRVIRNRQWMDS